MARELKFRAWDKIRNNMRFFILAHKHSILTDLPIPSKGQWEHLSDFMQFTGFEDINNKEAYHKDICKYKDQSGTEQKGIIEWDNGWFLDAIDGDDEGNQCVDLDDTFDGFEIVGVAIEEKQ